MKKLSIIIVNWNSVNYLRKSLASIFKTAADLDFEIIVVDNASYDGCAEMISSEFQAVKFIQSTQNLGFAGANNLGFAHSSSENLLFLNPDTEAVGDAIRVMLEHLKALPDAGAVGCKLLNSDLSTQTTCIQRFPTILNQMLNTDYLILRFPYLNFFGVRPLFFYKDAPEPVEVISGACLMTKRGVFQAAGMFSSEYFMYAEDLDLCYKIARMGFKAYYVGDAKVIHHGGRSIEETKVNYINSVLKRESVKKLLKKFKGETVASSYQFSMAIVSAVRICLLLSVLPVAHYRGRAKRIRISLTQWERVLRWSLGREKWAQSPDWKKGQKTMQTQEG